jgi:membrane protease YdiL (CAAX protease family)
MFVGDGVLAPERSESAGAGKPAEAARLLVLCSIIFGSARLAFWLSGRLGLATSSGLVFEGAWFAPSWARFPWFDCAGMLAFMCALPVLWERAHGIGLRAIGIGLDRKAALCTFLGLLCAAAVWSLRQAAVLPPRGSSYVGSLLVLGVYWLVVAAAEETAFRGILQRHLMRFGGLRVALPTATAAFVLWHGLPDSGLVLAVRAGGGLLLGLLYYGGKSLLPPVICHLALNVALVA